MRFRTSSTGTGLPVTPSLCGATEIIKLKNC